MSFAVDLNSAPAIKPIALACAFSLSLFAGAASAQEQAISTVHVTGSRFPADAALPTVGATVISADEIRSAGVTDVNQAIRKIGGVYGRQSLDGSPDFGLDLRGFGTNSSQNLVILVDGVRMNENELAGAVLSAIPVDTVERIEIARGGSSVLYGEGATGGVINIITRRGTEAGYHGSVSLERGRFDQHDARASVRHGEGALSFDLAAAHQGTDNYRNNNEFRQKTVSGGVQWATGASRLGLRVESARQDARFPGSLNLAEFEANPRQSLTPNDFGTLATDRVSLSGAHRIGAVELLAELAHRERDSRGHYETAFGTGDVANTSRQTQFSPRLRHLARTGGMLNEFVAGVDLLEWERVSTYASAFGTMRNDASQDSRAFYVRDEVRWDAAWNARLAVGARHERFEKDYADLGATVPRESSAQSQNAWSIEGSIDPLAGVTLHAKVGESYRVPNADENSYRFSNQVLDVQTSRDLEFGVTVGNDARRVSARVFRHRLRDEIFFDPTLFGGFGVNTNLDPTRRQGIELDGHLDLPAIVPGKLRLTGHVQHVKAEFTDGPNAGREMVLVPKNVVTARLAWLPGSGHSADIGAQYVSTQRYGSDFDNSCGARIPSYTTIDARYAVKVGAWEFAATGLNLGDRRYFSQAFGCRSGIYPSDARQLKLSARYDF
ncbi:TonB-dependent receptor family protein [Massilia niabensis]|uniref:TonB-dependent receptor family protein n=1 Tax=Massilia niabensis TaxID=544910 RepID=A0ABW0LBV7_9BURK